MESEIENKSDKEIAMITNQETENAAIIAGGDECSRAALEAPNTNTATRENTTNPSKLDGTFAIPVTPSNKVGLTANSVSSSRSSSLKKQNRISQDKSNSNGSESGKGRRSSENFLKSDLLKQSHSMMSLQAPSEEQLERRSVVQTKIHMERPYHSLKVSGQ